MYQIFSTYYVDSILKYTAILFMKIVSQFASIAVSGIVAGPKISASSFSNARELTVINKIFDFESSQINESDFFSCRRRPAGREQTARRPARPQAAPHDPHVSPEAAVQGLVRGLAEALPQGARGPGQGHRTQRESRPGLVSEPARQDEEAPAQGQNGARRQGAQGGAQQN